jgi:hypothetical protein
MPKREKQECPQCRKLVSLLVPYAGKKVCVHCQDTLRARAAQLRTRVHVALIEEEVPYEGSTQLQGYLLGKWGVKYSTSEVQHAAAAVLEEDS